MVLKVVGDGVSPTILTLDETLELDMCLLVEDRGVLGATDYSAFLLDRVEQAKGVSGRLERIEVGPVLYLALEVFVAAPQTSGEHLV